MKYATLFILLCFNATLGLANDKPTDKPPVWIDVRTPAEYEAGHLPGAHNINFDIIGARIAAVTANKNAPIILYCRSGRRSGLAKQTLEDLGYSNVVNAGGIDEVLRRAQRRPATGPDCVTREC